MAFMPNLKFLYNVLFNTVWYRHTIVLGLYGLECFLVAKADIKSLDFAVTRFLMKLFRTTNIDVIEECKLFFFNFLLHSEM